jgi:hypothetical protein
VSPAGSFCDKTPQGFSMLVTLKRIRMRPQLRPSERFSGSA